MLVDAAKDSHKPYYLMSSRPGVMNTRQAKALREAGLVQIGGTRQGLGAIDRIGRYMMAPQPLRTSAARPRSRLADLPAAKPGRRTINEYDAKRLLEEFGVPVTREQRVATIEQATRAARALGYPVVLKALSDDIPHKTELGLVAVGLANDDELARAFGRIRDRLDRLEPRPPQAALLVQEFVADGIEVFAGVARDPDFGLSLAFGMGGIAVDVTRDFALRMLPLRAGDAEAMIAETRGAAMLGSIRGRPAADVASLAACLEALADFAHHNADVLDEIDLNPIKALPQGCGCIVVDALIVARSPPPG
jgi:acyl-CoA synthetase (NDP forming)